MKLIILLWILANVLYLLIARRIKVRNSDLDDLDYLPFNDAERDTLQKSADKEKDKSISHIGHTTV